MEEAKRLLYEKVIKKFTLKDLIKAREFNQKNLIEMVSRYPGYGKGFKVAHRDWPDHEFYHVRDIRLFHSRYGRVKAVKYENNEVAGDKVEELRDVLKRGLWKYDMMDPKFTDPVLKFNNGLEYDLTQQQLLLNEKKGFTAERKRKMEILKKPEEPKKGVKGAPVKKK